MAHKRTTAHQKVAVKHPGALHALLGIPKDQPIPAQRLEQAAKEGGAIGRDARYAEALSGKPVQHESPDAKKS